MAINFPGGTQSGRAMIRAYRIAFTGQQETRNGVSSWNGFAGLPTLTHTIQASGNIVIMRLHLAVRGNAGTDSIQVRALRNGQQGRSGATGLMNTSTGNGVREIGTFASAAWAPNTSSNTYSWEWRAAEGGSSPTVNMTEEGLLQGQMLFELIEIEPDQTAGGGNAEASLAT